MIRTSQPILLVLILLTSHFRCSSQSSSPFFEEMNWLMWEKSYTQEDKLAIIDSIDVELTRYIKEAIHLTIENSIKNFHFIDYDGDGDHDIIYVGDAGTESYRTIFLEKKGNEWIEKVDIFGEVVSVNRNLPTSPISFTVLDAPCCAGNVFSINEYVIFSKGIENVSKLNYDENTVFPDKINMHVLFKVQNSKYNLRDAPSVKEKESSVLGVYPSQSEGIAFAKKTDETGREWWFVAMKNNFAPLSSIIHKGNTDEDYYSLGWMSNRYLEKL